jgi:hypothetical protein
MAKKEEPPAMTEDEIKAEMRLIALEHFVVNLFALSVLQENPEHPLEFFEMVQKQMIAGAHRQTFPAVDPSMSDLLSAELEAAIDRLAKSVADQIKVAKGLKNSG